MGNIVSTAVALAVLAAASVVIGSARPGFNIECNDGNKARWGFCLNCASQGCQNDDGNDADAAIGIGIAGQSTDTELGGGWTACSGRNIRAFAGGMTAAAPVVFPPRYPKP